MWSRGWARALTPKRRPVSHPRSSVAYMPCSIPRWTGSGARWLASRAFPRGFLPCPCSLPRFMGGSASTSLSRPAQASHALRPAQLLTHLSWALSRGSALASFRARALASYQSSTNNLLEWVLPPLVICAVEAHPTTPSFNECDKVFDTLNESRETSRVQNLLHPPTRTS